MQVRYADDGTELLQHEEADAVMNHAAPIQRPYEVPFFSLEAGGFKQRLTIPAELLAPGRVDEAVEKLVQPVTLHASLEREWIGTGQLLDAGELVGDVLQVLRIRRRRGRIVLVDGGGDSGHAGKVVTLVQLADLRRERATHRQPHDHFGAFE